LLVGDADLAGRVECPFQADAIGVAAGQQRGPRGTADGLRDVEVGEAHAVASHLVENRRAEVLRSVAAQVAVALVVSEDEDDVRKPGRLRVGGRRRERRQQRRPKDSQENATVSEAVWHGYPFRELDGRMSALGRRRASRGLTLSSRRAPGK